MTVYLEGIDETDAGEFRLLVELDPLGNGRYVAQDAIRATIGWAQLVYTDVTGLAGIGATPAAQVPRIERDQEPDGIATDWQAGVAGGSLLLSRLVTSEFIDEEIDQGRIRVEYGRLVEDQPRSFGPLPTNEQDGRLFELNDPQLHAQGQQLVAALGVAVPGQRWEGGTGPVRQVQGGRFYRPPFEFDPQQLSTESERMVHLGVRFTGRVETEGSKPNAITLVRPPVVLVHGINSGPDTWDTFRETLPEELENQTFPVDHSGADPIAPDQDGSGTYDEVRDRTWGNGDIDHMYVRVLQTIVRATNAYREGVDEFLEGNEVKTRVVAGHIGDQPRRIAVQRADIVAHSYGGLLSRWYMEQATTPTYAPQSDPEDEYWPFTFPAGQTFADREDVRKLITLGTPHKGSPFANMVSEIYHNGLIAAASADTPPFIPSAQMDWLLAAFDASALRPPASNLAVQSVYDAVDLLANLLNEGRPLLPTALTTDRNRSRHSYQILSVNGERLAMLNANPFRNEVGYAAVVGTNDKLYGILDAFELFNPLGGSSVLGYRHYFPWMNEFSGGEDASDAIVPTWSAALGVPSHNVSVEEHHIGLTSNSQVIQQVRQWLAQPLPRGAEHRAGFDPLPPPSERNAYLGSVVVGPDGYSVAAGLRREAIVKVEFIPTDASAWYGAGGVEIPATFPGLSTVRLTGMAPLSTIGLLGVRIYSNERNYPAGITFPEVTLDDLGTLLPQDVQVPAGVAQFPPNVWVPFVIHVGLVGRVPGGQRLFGPSGESLEGEWQYVGFELLFPEYTGLAPRRSPPTEVRLPE